MNPERWRKLDELFHAALEHEEAARSAFIVDACAGDDKLRQELESMIAHHEQARSFIESPAYALAAETLVSDDHDSLIGKSLGPYRIVRELGKGGMGVVFLAIDQKLRCKVALKLLPPHLTGDIHRVQRFKQEARAAAAVNHPNILAIHQIDEIEGQHFIATEFVEGETLRDVINRGPMEPLDALDVAIQIASALSVAHAAGIVHRDIKPENIMQRPDGLIKILDFGVAKLSEREVTDSDASTFIKTETGTALGTVRYMSPEQVRALEVDAGTDIWSFGVVLYEMLTSAFPFKGETAGDVMVGVLGAEPLPMPRSGADVPVELKRIVTKALQKDRAKRYLTADKMLGDLRKAKLVLDTGIKLDSIYDKKVRGAIVSVVAVLVLAAILVWVRVSWRLSPMPAASNEASASPATISERNLSYSLTVQKMRNSRSYDPPFESYGDDTFENGWKFRLNFSSPQLGFLYLINEGRGANGESALTTLYPDTSKGNGQAQLSVGQTTQTDWYVFDKNPGTEKLWMVWSANPVSELESVRRFLNPRNKGIISNRTDAQAVQQFLVEHSAVKPQLEKDTGKKQTIARAQGDVLVNALELEHH